MYVTSPFVMQLSCHFRIGFVPSINFACVYAKLVYGVSYSRVKSNPRTDVTIFTYSFTSCEGGV